MKKGVSNYRLRTQKQLDKLITLNNEVRCYSLYLNLTTCIEVESVEYLHIDQGNYEIYSKSSFNTVKYLSLKNLSTDQIKFILTRFKRIDRLKISRCSLEKIDLSQSRIKSFYFNSVSIKEPIDLPREIAELELATCESLNLIKAQKVNRIDFRIYIDDRKEYVELIKTLKGVKEAEISDYLEECLPSLPSTIKKIRGSWNK